MALNRIDSTCRRMFTRVAASVLFAAAPTAQSAPLQGTVEKVVVHGNSLEGALLGYSADREVFVYLPPSYRTSSKRRYPVVYSLHGFGGSGESWVKRLGAPESFDRALRWVGRCSPAP
jgi:enterochelin esterase-like enzyme